MKRRVVITAYSVINDMGKNKAAVEEGIFSGKSGISVQPFEYADGVTEGPFGTVRELTEEHPFFAEHSLPVDRCSQLALMAADDCMRESGLDMTKEDPYRCGVSIGTSLGGMRSGDEFHKQWIAKGPVEADGRFLKQYPIHAVADIVAMELQFKGCKNIISTACSAGGNSLGYAYDLIVNGSHDIIIAGGVDPMSRFSFAGFTALKAIDHEPCRPYSASTGINLAEGASFLMMEEYGHAKARGARIIAEFLGYGITADAYHQTAPEPGGGGAMRAMAAALRSGGIEKKDVSYVNGHGTGTHANDTAESSAMNTFFGELAASVPLSSTKGATGHCLGAAGSVEAAISIMAMERQEVPPTVRFEGEGTLKQLDYVPNTPRKHMTDIVMSNSFAFGGNNCCILLGGPETGKEREETVPERIVLTGMGCVGAGGNDIASLFSVFESAERKIVPITEFDVSVYGCKIKLDGEEPNWKKMIPIKFLRRTDEITKLTMACGRQAMDSARLTVTRQNMERIGLIYGTGAGPMTTIEAINRACIEEGIHAVDPSSFPNSVLNQAPGSFCIANMLKGPTSTIAVSMASELAAFYYACELLKSDQADAIVVAGADEWNEPLLMGHDKCGLLTKTGTPAFVKGSDGMLLSEGAAAFVLEKESFAKARGAKILATVLSEAICSDNSPLGEVAPDGEALEHCIRDAVAGAGCEKIDLYSSGACGVAAIDQMEQTVIGRVFDENTSVSNAQALVGTPIGAAGGYGLLSALYSFQSGKIAALPAGEYEIAPGMETRMTVGKNAEKEVNTACVTSIGLGGTFVSIVLGKGEYHV